MDPLTIFFLIISGLLFGILSVMVGIGGGLMNVPFLDFVMGLDTAEATFVSSFVIIFTSTSGAIKYRSEKKIDYKTGLNYLVLAVPGVIIGGWFANKIPRIVLRQLFGVLVSLASIRGLSKVYSMDSNPKNSTKDAVVNPVKGVEVRKIIDKDGKEYEYEVKIGIGRLFAFLGGLIAGLLGIGGGIIYMPVLTSISGVPVHIAAATSTSMIVVVSILAIITRIIALQASGDLDLFILLEYGVPLAFGAVIGARIGATKMKKLNSKLLLGLFWSIAFIAGIRMLITPFIS